MGNRKWSTKSNTSVFFLGCLLFLGIFFLIASNSIASITVTATVAGICGNGLIEPGEQCDSGDLNNKTCQSFNFATGTLSCSGACSFDISQCMAFTPPPAGGGGGGGGGNSTNNSMTGVTFSGKAYPLSKVTLLKNGNEVVSTISGPDASFSISLDSFPGGNYIFALLTEDSKGIKSNLFSVPVYISPGASTIVKGIYLAPTIAIDKIEVKKNDTISIFGQSTATSSIVFAVNSTNEVMKKTMSDDSGIYLYNLDTSFLEYGDHSVKSKAVKGNEISGVSPTLSFKVSDKNVMAPKSKANLIGDYSLDGHVNLVDFSIGAYWYKKTGFPKLIDLNGDGKIDLVDFSILVYHWTG